MKAFIRSKNEEIQTPGYPVHNCTQTSQVHNSMHDNALRRIRYAIDHPERERGGWATWRCCNYARETSATESCRSLSCITAGIVYCKSDYSILKVRLIKQFTVSTRSGRLHHSYAVTGIIHSYLQGLQSSNTSSGLKPLFESESELTRASITRSRVRSGLCASSQQEAVQKSCISDSRFFHCLSSIYEGILAKSCAPFQSHVTKSTAWVTLGVSGIQRAWHIYTVTHPFIY